MAELDIGKHCSFESCHQLDFLPFTCDSCGLIFCVEHKFPEHHACSKCKVVENAHIYTGPRSYRCDLDDCTQTELTPVICDACKLNFCLKHRHQVDHRCKNYVPPGSATSKAVEHVQEIIKANSSKPRKKQGRKSQATAAKVNLMKIKMSAIGDKACPHEERVFLRVMMPLGGKEKMKHMFFSKKWSVGRIIDQIATMNKLTNNNNVNTAKKLRIFNSQSGDGFGTAAQLEDLLSPSDCDGSEEVRLYNGDTIILEYVANEENFIENVQLYQT